MLQWIRIIALALGLCLTASALADATFTYKRTEADNTSKEKTISIARFFAPIPFLGYLLGFLVCVLIETVAGGRLAEILGLPKTPVLFGIVTIFKVVAGMVNAVLKDAVFESAALVHIPMAILYVGIVYLAPLLVVSRLTAVPANGVARLLQRP